MAFTPTDYLRLKIANWFAENQRNIARFRAAARTNGSRKNLRRCRQRLALGPEIEERICKRSGLSLLLSLPGDSARTATRNFLSALALIAATLEKLRSKFATSSAPKSAKPKSRQRRAARQLGHAHSASPVACEQICGLARPGALEYARCLRKR